VWKLSGPNFAHLLWKCGLVDRHGPNGFSCILGSIECDKIRSNIIALDVQGGCWTKRILTWKTHGLDTNFAPYIALGQWLGEWHCKSTHVMSLWECRGYTCCIWNLFRGSQIGDWLGWVGGGGKGKVGVNHFGSGLGGLEGWGSFVNLVHPWTWFI
jgi:hypothetical protein